MGLGSWLLRPTTTPERILAVTGGLLLFYATTTTDLVGLILFTVAIVLHLIRRP